jgi:carbamoyl-phosphate synthase large subunit
VVIICSIENIDAMGVHTGDSMTVAPAQTLTDKEYQRMRDASLDIIREIGVETGGSNIQFALNPKNGDMIVIEMNPRVSRSSALASKATGFPIAKLAAKLAVGYTLDELKNDITKDTPACFEPVLDYCVVKVPRFNFDKFPQAKPELGVSMKSVGEVMAIGRTFKESFQKALRSMEEKRFGFGFDGKDEPFSDDDLYYLLTVPTPKRLFAIQAALKQGYSMDRLYELTHIDPWFLNQFKEIVDLATSLDRDPETIRQAKSLGFSDRQIMHCLGDDSELGILNYRQKNNIKPVYKIVDTCAGEFEAVTPYYYSSYDQEDELADSDNQKVMILGSGPNRIGQGVEFDYCCVHAAFACKEQGVESIMVNSNPETVSTDFDSSDRLYFEPLTFEDVLSIYQREQPTGVIVQFGGQTPLNLAESLEAAGVTILGTSQESIHRTEDREAFQALVTKLGLRQPKNGIVFESEEAVNMAESIGYPVILRPSYVLGGASMEVVYNSEDCLAYMKKAVQVSPGRPILIDQFLESAIEVDVDAVADGTDCVIAGIMEHIEEAESPECTPASSICSIIPAITQSVPSATASTSTSIADSKN